MAEGAADQSEEVFIRGGRWGEILDTASDVELVVALVAVEGGAVVEYVAAEGERFVELGLVHVVRAVAIRGEGTLRLRATIARRARLRILNQCSTVALEA